MGEKTMLGITELYDLIRSLSKEVNYCLNSIDILIDELEKIDARLEALQ